MGEKDRALIEELMKALEKMEQVCRKAAHPAAPVTLTRSHVEHLREIADYAFAALSRAKEAGYG